jgi:hypothetical protein
MPAPPAILELIERFDRNLRAYKQSPYNEAQARSEFIDPFFKALGWDMYNELGYSQAYRQVIYEDSIKVGGGTKAPDYCFRIGGVRKFFVEAKKPSVDIRGEISPAYQLRRYAWSVKMPLSVLTDFEEFAVYDCRVKPDKSDKASAARVMYLGYRDYPERWDEIAGVFSPEAIQRGSFDKYIEEQGAKRGTAEVDVALLQEIEGWREALARNIALRNTQIRQRDLNFAVQQTIDRIIFLRICEDRGIEPYGVLLGLTNGAAVYGRLMLHFRHADARYNSGLFHFEVEKGRAETPDMLTPGLVIEDKVLRDIIKRLYYPDSPYEFSQLPVEVLGQVYEQFLGKVIRLISYTAAGGAPGHRAVVEEKPAVRKAGGVYYTPAYIVDYIVKQTVGRLLEGRRDAGTRGRGDAERKAAPLRILDPACGSGSFLLGAYQYLLDWHRDRYVEDGAQKWARGSSPRLYQAAYDEWKLTIAERKRILLDSIYGVDIDSQAVEVTKLSLLLKVLEGESEQTLSPQLALFPERALPDLANNIKCGNSLIGPAFYDQPGLGILGEEEALRINAFDWEKEFPGVFRPDRSLQTCQVCGFDAVIGNPPYIRIQALREWAPREVEHYKQAYRAASKGNYDIYVVFVEKGLQLLNENGRLGFILPHKFFNARYGEPLRGLLSDGQYLSKVVHFGDQQVFEGATTYTCLLFLAKGGHKEFEFVRAHDLPAWRAGAPQVDGTISAESAGPSEWNFVVGRGTDLFERLREMPVKLGNVAHLFVGLQTDADDVYILELDHVDADTTYCRSAFTGAVHRFETQHLKSFIKGSLNIRRYYFSDLKKRLIFPYQTIGTASVLISPSDYACRFPLTWAYLHACKSRLASRNRGKMSGVNWYGYVYRKNHVRLDSRKLLVPSLALGATFAPDLEGRFFFVGSGGGGGGGYGISLETAEDSAYFYLLGVLNSRLSTYMLKQVSTPFRGGYIALNKQYIEQLPIRTIDFTDPADVARHDRMVALVTQMLDLHKRLAAEQVPHVKTALERQIEATDRQIDALVYELYGLTEEEIGVVEGM